MKFLWCVVVGLALSCFAGESFGMFGKSTETVLFEAIANGNDAEARKAIDAPSKMLMKKYATNLTQTAGIEIQDAVQMTTLESTTFAVKNLENTTPLILAVLLGRSTIIDKLIEEFTTNKRSIGHKVEAILSGMDEHNNMKSLKVSAIDVARLLGNKELVKKFIAKDIGSNADIRVAKEWLQKRKLEKKLKTLQESLTRLKEKLNQLTQSLQLLKANLTI